MKKRDVLTLPNHNQCQKKRLTQGKRYWLIFMFVLAIPILGYSQDKPITLNVTDVPLKEVLSSIEKQSGYYFQYSSDQIDADTKISLNISNGTLKDVLEKLFKGKVQYSISNRQVMLAPAQKGGKTIPVKGKVTDASGASLPGVTVVVKGKSGGTTTNSNGEYSLSGIAENSVLVYSFIGMKKKEVPLMGKSEVNVSLEDETKKLDEVVVTALGIKRETKTIGYSIQSLPSKSIEASASLNVVNALAGKIAGVQINQSSGGADGSTSIVIRGQSSLLGNNQPLFVVDGIMIDNNQFNASDGGFDRGNGISNLNPEDFESISVLKGPNAAALYGARAANGVIIITSKKGGASSGLGISVSSTLTWEMPYQLKKFQNLYGSGESPFWDDYPVVNGMPSLNVAWNNFGPLMDGKEVMSFNGKSKKFLPQPNNIIDFYQPGFSSVNNIALSGGNDQTGSAYRISITSREKSSTVPTNRSDKYNISFNGSQKLNEVITAKINANFVKAYGKNRPRVGNSGSAWDYHSGFFPRDISFDEYKSGYKKADGSKQTANPWGYNNAFWELYENLNKDEDTRFIGGIEVNSVLFKQVNLSLKANTDNDLQRYITQEAGIRTGGAGGLYSTSQESRNQQTYEFLLSWNKQLMEKLSFSVNAGGQSFTSTYNSIGGRTDGDLQVPNFFSLSNSSKTPIASEYYSQKKINSLYMFGQIGYDDILYLDYTARNDWSSTLPKKNNSYFYPSLSAGFIFSKAFGINKSVLEFGKLRVSWAKVGKDTDPYQLYSTYSAGLPYGTIPTANTPSIALLPNIKPELTTSLEIGANLVFLSNRINLDFSYYQSSSKNQIIPLPVSNASAITSTLINAGEIRNKGFELMLNVVPLKTNDFRWDMTFNYSKNKNMVVDLLGDRVETLELRRNGDGPVIVEARPGRPYGDILVMGIKKDDNDRPIINAAGHYIQDGDLQVAGNIQPDWTGGLTNDFSYKGWRLHTLLDFSIGGQLYSYTTRWITARGASEASLFGRDKEHGGIAWTDAKGRTRNDGIIIDGVTESGQKNTKVISALEYYNNDYQNNFPSHIQSASYIMLRELSLSYTVPSKLIGKIGFVKKLELSLIGNNIAFLRNDSGILNAIATSYGSSNGSKGIETGSHPASRIFGFSVNASF